MKDEGLESYFSKVLRIEYRINPIKLSIVDLISCMSSYKFLILKVILLGGYLTVKRNN